LARKGKPAYSHVKITGLKGEGQVYLRFIVSEAVILRSDRRYGKRKMLKVPLKIDVHSGPKNWQPYPVAVVTSTETRVFGKYSRRWQILSSLPGKPDRDLIKKLIDRGSFVEEITA
jgi:hypothetical protein